MPPLLIKSVLSVLPAQSSVEPRAAAAKVVVLDDDPTGTQTVHGIPVLSDWSIEPLAAELAAPEPCFYILTNSRALSERDAVVLNRTIGHNLATAAKRSGREFRVISRSDSTLRGHFPAETSALSQGLGISWDATLLIPAFFAGGRLTIEDVHYVAVGETLVPAAETEFARDAEFGYRHSNLRDWVEERSGGTIKSAEVGSISLADLRIGGPRAVISRLESLPTGSVAIVNAAAPSDLAVLTHALAALEARGKRYLYRTAADFVPAYSGIKARPLLTPAELQGPQDSGGLLVAGSYVGRTSAQLEALFAARADLTKIEMDVDKVRGADRDGEIVRMRATVDQALGKGQDVVLFTSRSVVASKSAADFGEAGRKISEALVEVVRKLTTRPRWMVAKGGITSNDIATKALGVRRGIVLGQALPGVPVWECGPESKWPGLAYVVFPGNVGGPESLAALIEGLRRSV